MVWLHHPELDVTQEFPDSSQAMHAMSGWVEVDAPPPPQPPPVPPIEAPVEAPPEVAAPAADEAPAADDTPPSPVVRHAKES